jgi:hypothetical protein
VTVRHFLVRNVSLREFNMTVVISRSFLGEIGVMTLVCGHFPGGEGVALLRRQKRRKNADKRKTSAPAARQNPG